MKRNTKKKLLSTLGMTVTIAAPLTTIVAASCSSSTEWTWENHDLSNRVTHIEEREIKLNGSPADFQTAVVTDAGKVTDKSFNQSALEAMQTIGNATKVANKFIEPSTSDKIQDGYSSAIELGAKNLVLPGFVHMGVLNGMTDLGANAIVIDGWNPSSEDVRKKTISLAYKVEQAAYLAGYAAADYLVSKGDTDPKVGAWAGSNAKGVTNFVLGFLYGVDAYNKANSGGVQVTFAGNSLTLNSGFAAGGGKTVAQNLVANGADIILGVAGPQTSDGLIAIDGKETKIIGVDVDQSKAYASDAEKFFTSIEKNIGQSTYDTLANIYESKVKAFDSTITTSTKTSPQWGTTISGGLDEEWTGISPTTMEDSLATAAIDKANMPNIITKAKAISNKFTGDYTGNLEALFTGSGELSALGIATITK